MTSSQREAPERDSRVGGWVALAIGVLVLVLIAAWVVTSSAGPQPVDGSSSSPTGAPSPRGGTPPSTTTAMPVAPTPTPGMSVEPEPAARETLDPVPLDSLVAVSPTIDVRLVSIEPITGIANIAGEIDGPALRVTVSATNGGDTDFETPAVVVNLYTGVDRTPAGTVREPGGRDFAPTIAPGRSAEGVFIFTVPEDARGLVLVEVDLRVGEPVVLFEGAVR